MPKRYFFPPSPVTCLVLFIQAFFATVSFAQSIRNWDWSQSAGSAGAVVGADACEKAGMVYVVGNADPSGTLRFGNSPSLIPYSKGKTVCFIASYTSSGSPIQLAYIGAGGNCTLNKVQADNQGWLYILGSFTGTCTFGSFTLTNPNSSSLDRKPFVAKVSPSGFVQWVTDCGSGAYSPEALLLLPTGKLALRYTVPPGTGNIGSYMYTAPGTVYANSSSPAATIFAQLSPTGAIEWATKFDDPVASLAVDNTNNYFLCGVETANGSTQLQKRNAFGQVLGSVVLNGVGTPFNTRPYGLAVDVFNNVYLSSNFQYSLTLGSYTITAFPDAQGASTSNGFVAKFSNALAVGWLTNTKQVQPRELLVAPSGAVYQIGEHLQTLTYGSYTVPYTATGQYDRNLYALSLSAAGVITGATKVGAVNNYIFFTGAVLENNGDLAISTQEEVSSTSNGLRSYFITALTPGLALNWRQRTQGYGSLVAAAGGGVYQCGQLLPSWGSSGAGYPGWQSYVWKYTDLGIKAWEQFISSGQTCAGLAIVAQSAQHVYTATSAPGIFYYMNNYMFGTDPFRSVTVHFSTVSNSPNFKYAEISSIYRDAQATAVALNGTAGTMSTGYFTGEGRAWNIGQNVTPVMLTAASAGSGTADQSDAFVAKYDTTLNLQWIRQLGGTGADKGSGVAVDAAGCTYAIGTFTGTGTFVSTTLASAGALDGYVVKLDPSGNLLWAIRFGGTGNDEPAAIALGAGGRVYVSGRFTGTTRFGALPSFTSAGNYDAFLACFDATTGGALWAQKAGASGNDGATAVAVEASGNPFMAGSFSGTVGFGATSLTSAGGTDAFVAAYTSAGSVLWSRRYGSTGADEARSLALLSPNKLSLAGSFQGTVAFGPSNLTSRGGLDAFVAQLTAVGTAEQAWSLGGPGDDVAHGVSADPVGNLYLSGAFSDSLDVGPTRLRSRSFAQNAFYARLAIPHTWTGAVSQDWTDARNWSDNVVPTRADDVVLPGGAVRYPLLTTGTVQTNALTVQAGASLTVNGGVVDLAGDLRNDGGTITQGAGLVRLSGTTPQTIASTADALVLKTLEIGPAGAVLTGPLHIAETLTVRGPVQSAGNLTLLSSSAGTALVVNAGGQVVGASTVQRYIDPTGNPGPGYRHYSAPVSNSTVADLATSGFAPVVNPAYNASATPTLETPFPTVFGYDQSRLALANNLDPFSKGYFSPAALSSPLVVGRGYTVNLPATALVDFVGTLNTGDQPPLTLERNTGATAADAGWHLIGNPYPAPLDYSLVAPADRVGLDAAMYVFESSSQYGGTYRSYVNGIGNPLIGTAQGFFVRVSSGQTSGTLTFRDSQRLTAPTPVTFHRTSSETRPVVQLRLAASTGASDDVFVYAQPGATAGFDPGFDAAKRPNSTGLNATAVGLNGPELAIQGLPALAQAVVPLTVQAAQAGTYAWRAPVLLNVPTGLIAWLVDHDTGQRVNLHTLPAAGYVFFLSAAQAAVPVTGRFELRFEAAGALATRDARRTGFELYPNPAKDLVQVRITPLDGVASATLTVFDALGRIACTQRVPLSGTGVTRNIDLTALPAGVYAVRLETGAESYTHRLVVE